MWYCEWQMVPDNSRDYCDITFKGQAVTEEYLLSTTPLWGLDILHKINTFQKHNIMRSGSTVYLNTVVRWLIKTKHISTAFNQLAMGWTVQGLNPDGGKIFCTCPDQPWGPPSLLYNGYQVFPRGKRAARVWRWSPPPSSAMVKKE